MTNQNEFLPKDPTKALIEVKDILYDRLGTLRICMAEAERDKYGFVDPYDAQMNNEVEFLEALLDLIERS